MCDAVHQKGDFLHDVLETFNFKRALYLSKLIKAFNFTIKKDRTFLLFTLLFSEWFHRYAISKKAYIRKDTFFDVLHHIYSCNKI